MVFFVVNPYGYKTFVKTMSNNKFSSDNGFANYLALILFIGLIIGVSFLYFLTR